MKKLKSNKESPWHKKKVFALTLGAVVCTFIILIGPWPVYRSSGFEKKGYYEDAVRQIREQASRSSGYGGRLSAGWGVRKLSLPEGTPLAGYGERKGRPSTGVHDEIYIKALAMTDTHETVIIVGSDLLIVPHNISETVRREVVEKVLVRPEAILFNASHTHSGPGGSTRGLLARFFVGKFSNEIEHAVIDAYVDAMVDAHRSMSPVSLTHGSVDAPDYIKNRVREQSVAPATVDSNIDYLVIEKDDGGTCYVVRYSAHATVVGHRNMEFSGDFPGYLQRYIEETTGGTAIYLAGAVGSMGPRLPVGADDFIRASAMGKALADIVLRDIESGGAATFKDTADLKYIGFQLVVPPLQLRITRNLRLSSLFLRIVGIRRKTWLSSIAVDEIMLVGFPGDLSGEISLIWKNRVKKDGIILIPLSFNGAYAGYISPDAYYSEIRLNGKLAYETAIMSWCGPDQEIFFTMLLENLIEAMYH